MRYILLLKFATPSGEKNTWENYSDKASLKKALDRHIEVSERYGELAGIFAPRLIDYVIIETPIIGV